MPPRIHTQGVLCFISGDYKVKSPLSFSWIYPHPIRHPFVTLVACLVEDIKAEIGAILLQAASQIQARQVHADFALHRLPAVEFWQFDAPVAQAVGYVWAHIPHHQAESVIQQVVANVAIAVRKLETQTRYVLIGFKLTGCYGFVADGRHGGGQLPVATGSTDTKAYPQKGGVFHASSA